MAGEQITWGSLEYVQFETEVVELCNQVWSAEKKNYHQEAAIVQFEIDKH